MGAYKAGASLADNIDAARDATPIRFSLCQTRGWVATHSEDAIRVLCDMWNRREEIAVALREKDARGL